MAVLSYGSLTILTNKKLSYWNDILDFTKFINFHCDRKITFTDPDLRINIVVCSAADLPALLAFARDLGQASARGLGQVRPGDRSGRLPTGDHRDGIHHECCSRQATPPASIQHDSHLSHRGLDHGGPSCPTNTLWPPPGLRWRRQRPLSPPAPTCSFTRRFQDAHQQNDWP